MAYKAILIVIIFGALACIDIPGIVKNKQWRDLIIYSAFLLMALTFTLLYQAFNISFSWFTRWFIGVTSNG